MHVRSLLLAASLMGGMAAAQRAAAVSRTDDGRPMFGRGSVGAPFTLTDPNGKPHSDSDFRGKLMIVYFGYTFCPDVCPIYRRRSRRRSTRSEGCRGHPAGLHHHRSRTRQCRHGRISPGFSPKLHWPHWDAGGDPQSCQFLQDVLRKGRRLAIERIFDRSFRRDLSDGPRREISWFHAAPDHAGSPDRYTAQYLASG